MSDEYGSEFSEYGSDQDYAPSAHAGATGPVVTGNAQVSTLRRGLEGPPSRLRGLEGPGGLGDFSPTQLCYVRPLARLAWAFIALNAEGRNYDALGILSVYRALFNSQREAIVGGFNSAAAREALPASLPEIAWTDAMRLSMMLILSSVASRPEQARALAALPASMAQIAAWFATNHSLFDEAALHTYLEVPRMGGEEIAPAVLRAVQDDVNTCLAPPAPTPAPPSGGGFTVVGPTGIAPCPPGQFRFRGDCMPMGRAVGSDGQYINYVRCPDGSFARTPGECRITCPDGTRARSVSECPSSNGGGGNGGGGGGGGGGGTLLVVLALLAAGAYWVYRKDSAERTRP